MTATDNMIKIGIIDNDPVWIKLITDFLHKENDLIVLWSATNQEIILNRAKGRDVDIVLMEIDFGESIIKEISQNNKVIIMTSSSHEELLKKSIIAGAINYILKKDYQCIPTLVRLAYNQLSPVEMLFKDYNKTKSELELSELTPTEKELYMLKKQGYSILQIAAKTNKSEGTVRNQLCKAYKKLKEKQR